MMDKRQRVEEVLVQASSLGQRALIIAGAALWRHGGPRTPDDVDIALMPEAIRETEVEAALKRAFPSRKWKKGAHRSSWMSHVEDGQCAIDVTLDRAWLYEDAPTTDPTNARLASLEDIGALKIALMLKREEEKDPEDLRTLSNLRCDIEASARNAGRKLGLRRARRASEELARRGPQEWARAMHMLCAGSEKDPDPFGPPGRI